MYKKKGYISQLISFIAIGLNSFCHFLMASEQYALQDVLLSLGCTRVAIWRDASTEIIPTKSLITDNLFQSCLQLYRENIYPSQSLSDNYSFFFPEVHAIIIDDLLLKSNAKNIAMAILDAKKTNASYLCGIVYYDQNNKRCPSLHEGPFGVSLPIQIVHNQSNNYHALYGIAIYKIDDCFFPETDIISTSGISVLTQSLKNPILSLPYHFGVVRSVSEGLKKINASYNCNPKHIDDLHKNVLVLCNREPFLEAIELKKQGRLSLVYCGPNYVFDHTMLEADAWVCPGLWTQEHFLHHHPIMHSKVYIWPAGVNVDFWKPSSSKQSQTVLLYKKNKNHRFHREIKKLLQSYGWRVLEIEYGKYIPEDFRQALDIVQMAIFISDSESQGIALAEAWSMDVPTLVWQSRNPEMSYAGYRFKANAAPYLNKNNGVIWQDLDELSLILEKLPQILAVCAPRRWVLRNMSDEVIAFDLLRIFERNHSKYP